MSDDKQAKAGELRRSEECTKKEWECIVVLDGKENDPNASPILCEMCKVHHVRYGHYMWHESTGAIRVGRDCAEKMARDAAEQRSRHRKAINRSRRRARWLKRNWERNGWGMPYLCTNGHKFWYEPTKEGCWTAIIDGIQLSTEFRDLDTAKLATFDIVWVP